MKSLLAERSANFYSVLSVRHLHISHDAAYLPPKFRVTFVFHFSWVLQPSQQKLKNNAYEKFLGANKVHYGRCASGVLRIQQSPLQYSALFALSAAALGLDDVSNSNKICGIVLAFNRPFSSSKNSLSKRGWVQNLVQKSYICMRLKIIFISMVSHFVSHWNRGLGQLENGPLEPLNQNNLRDIPISWPTP